MMKTVMRKVLLIMTAMTLLFCLPSYASGTCGVKGCYKSSVYGSSYCSSHICSKYNCKNLAVDGGYCGEHQKKTYGSSSSSSSSPGRSSSKTCVVSGCSRSTTVDSSYCYTHKCKHSGCKNFGLDDGYCASHAKKSSSSSGYFGKNSSGNRKTGSVGSGSSAAKQCIVTGCHNSRTGSSSYCSKHKCAKSGCANKADGSGYCSRHHFSAGDPYDVYDYSDPEDFYFDWEDDFEDYEDAEDYWDSAWD